MSAVKDEFEVLVLERESDDALTPSATAGLRLPALHGVAAVARLHSFDLEDQPLVVDVPELPRELVRARTTVPLRREDIGSNVVVVFERGDVSRPIVLGVLEPERRSTTESGGQKQRVSVQTDGDRVELSAEREIVLRCGEASITLTRAGKILIHGAYVLSRSTGVNKIKGASVDIN